MEEKEIQIYKEKANPLLERAKIDIRDAESVSIATDTLSQLNHHLDRITAHKEQKTKPLNEALKAIRNDYRPLEAVLINAITTLRSNLTAYATELEKNRKAEEQKILDNKRTTLDTKINKLAELEEIPEKIEAETGSITFTTVTKYRLIDPCKVPPHLLELDLTRLKAHLKGGYPLPEGIEKYEEKSLRNYR